MIGPKKSALMMHAIGADRARVLMSKMNAAEIDILSGAMDNLGIVAAETMENYLLEFANLIEVQPAPTRLISKAEQRAHDVNVSGSAPSSPSRLTDFTA